MKRISRDCLHLPAAVEHSHKIIRNQLPAESKKSAVIQCAHQGWREPVVNNLASQGMPPNNVTAAGDRSQPEAPRQAVDQALVQGTPRPC
jgi:hypothetical protein